jgi:4-alpha-glucanotransferase
MSRDSIDRVPFAGDYRASGILLHVTSLPSADGIGDLGPPAFSWIDRLEEAGQSWWQSLPLGPTGYGNSPYQPLSSFAGNALVISSQGLVEDELLTPSDCEHPSLAASVVDYDTIIPFKHRLFEKAWDRFRTGTRTDLRPEFEKFCHDHDQWLPDYSLFRALKAKFSNVHYLQWPSELVLRQPSALEQARGELSDRIGQASFAQFLLFRQAERMRAHAHKKGLTLMGDLPFFVSDDSSDVWANPQFFLLDEKYRPRYVAGVPPDYFSSKGQLWGNPVYNWEALRQTGYRWWIARVRSLLCHVDVIRLDHFRGFAAAWHVPAGAPTAEAGKWVPGPGIDLFQAIEKELGRLPFVAEDLGLITPDVSSMRDRLHLPGMRVLQFAFDGHKGNPHLPENFDTNTVVYTATHDNPTTRSWFEDLPVHQREIIWTYLKERGANSTDPVAALIDIAWDSVAALAIIPLQDLLNLGKEARMNVPGRPDGNWRWRATESMLADSRFDWLRDLTRSAGRA